MPRRWRRGGSGVACDRGIAVFFGLRRAGGEDQGEGGGELEARAELHGEIVSSLWLPCKREPRSPHSPFNHPSALGNFPKGRGKPACNSRMTSRLLCCSTVPWGISKRSFAISLGSKRHAAERSSTFLRQSRASSTGCSPRTS